MATYDQNASGAIWRQLSVKLSDDSFSTSRSACRCADVVAALDGISEVLGSVNIGELTYSYALWRSGPNR